MIATLEYVLGIYSIVIGFSVIALWIMLVLTKQIPELEKEPITIYFHVSAEIAMGVVAILSGVFILLELLWGKYLFLVSSGICIYAVINSSGYYAQRKTWVFIILFAVILLTSSILSILTIISLINPGVI